MLELSGLRSCPPPHTHTHTQPQYFCIFIQCTVYQCCSTFVLYFGRGAVSKFNKIMLKNEFYKLKLNIFSSEYLQSSPVVIQRPTGYSKELFSMGGRINLKGVGTFGFTTLSHCTYIILCSRSRVWYNGGRMEGCPLRG